jgi:hypothetical protein
MRIGIALLCVAGCAVPARPAAEEGLPLLTPAARPAPEAVAAPIGPTPPSLSAAECGTLDLVLPETHGVLTRETYARAFEGARAALREAVCACPPRAREAWMVVRTTPDHGDLSARSREPDGPIDACLADHLRGASLPRWHLGGDCIGCGPRRYGVFRGSPPADSEPEDGIATLTFLVGVAR